MPRQSLNMSARKPVILIVHGSWHQPAHFDLQIEALHQAGYSTHCPLLPSTAGFADVGVAQDAARIRQELDLILTPDAQGHVPDVVVFGHSYGGVVMADSVLPRYSKRSRTLTGRKGGVVRLVYASAFLLVPGQCLVDAFPGTGLLPPFLDHEVSVALVSEPNPDQDPTLTAVVYGNGRPPRSGTPGCALRRSLDGAARQVPRPAHTVPRHHPSLDRVERASSPHPQHLYPLHRGPSGAVGGAEVDGSVRGAPRR